MAVTALEALPADENIRDLERRWGISRNALKARAKALVVELIRIASTQIIWPGAFIEVGDQLHHHLQSGRPMSEFGGVAPVTDGTAITSTGPVGSEVVSLLARIAANSEDPLKRPNGLHRAAEANLPLNAADLKALGVRGVINSREDMVDRYGYRFQRHQPGGKGSKRWWNVHHRHVQLSLAMC